MLSEKAVILRGFKQTTTGRCMMYPFLEKVKDIVPHLRRRFTTPFQFRPFKFSSDNKFRCYCAGLVCWQAITVRGPVLATLRWALAARGHCREATASLHEVHAYSMVKPMPSKFDNIDFTFNVQYVMILMKYIYTMSRKKETKTFFIISPIKLGWCWRNMIHLFLNKFAAKWYKRFPPHLNNVPTLPYIT